MNICFIAGTLARGGAEKQLIFMLRVLQQIGVSTRILCLTKGESYEDEIRDLGLTVEWVGESNNRALRLLKIIECLRHSRADLVQSTHFYTNIYAGAAGTFLKIPSIGAVRSDLIYEIKSHKILGRWQISLPHMLIVNSIAAHQRLLDRGVSPQKVEFVRNVVENGAIPTLSNELSDRALNIIFVGRLDRNKRPERFVRLAAKLNGRFPNLPLRFRVAGDGELKSELEIMARDHGLLPDKLKFLGVCPDMNKIYRQSDILISTSDSEGTPNVILEAMAHGLPVVATKVGGTAEILNESRGVLIDPGDEKELEKATAELILNKELRFRLGSEGRAYVAQNHSLAYLQEQLIGIYEKLVQKR